MALKYLAILAILPMLLIPAFAETQALSTNTGVLDVRIIYDDINPTTINIEFLNSQTRTIQDHIDYTISVSKDGQYVYGPIPPTHTSVGVVNIPIDFNLGDGIYTLNIGVEGILFAPLPTETVSFDILVGEVDTQPKSELILHEEINITIFAEVVTLLQYLINAFNEVITSVNSNTSDIAELKQQIIELQNP